MLDAHVDNWREPL